jgi:hypothetical protein
MKSMGFVKHPDSTVDINIEYETIFDEDEECFVVFYTVSNSRGEFCESDSFPTSEKSVDDGINEVMEKYRNLIQTLSIQNDYSCSPSDGGNKHISKSAFDYIALSMILDVK